VYKLLFLKQWSTWTKYLQTGLQNTFINII
jgi:hypothetical protein